MVARDIRTFVVQCKRDRSVTKGSPLSEFDGLSKDAVVGGTSLVHAGSLESATPLAVSIPWVRTSRRRESLCAQGDDAGKTFRVGPMTLPTTSRGEQCSLSRLGQLTAGCKFTGIFVSLLVTCESFDVHGI